MKYSDLHNGFSNLHKYLGWLLFILATGLATSVSMAAEDQAATVVFANGSVTATSSAHGERPLNKSDPVFNSDRIDTATNGRGQLRFTDGGLVSLMPNTTFSVEDYFYEDEAKGDSAVFGLLKGGLRTITGSIGKVKHEDYELKTPVATLGIRGTEYVAVIQPANTLRVHVGRGKVVITNDHGTLEVPEGRNAVVSLGGAPEFSEKGPVFVATAPNGDKLLAGMMPTQDPNLLNPDVDIVVPDYVTLTGAGGSPVLPAPMAIMPPPGGPGPGGPGGGGPNPGNPNPGGSTGPVGPPVPMIAGGYIDGSNWETAKVFSVEQGDLDPSNAMFHNIVGSNSLLEWGSYGGGGSVDLEGTNINVSDSNMAYVKGDAIVDYMPAGMLNYSMAGATGVEGGTWDLTQFDLGLDLGNSGYTLDFMLDDGNSMTYTSNTSGSLNSGSASQGFGFNTSDVQSNDPSGIRCSTGCNLDVQGFLAGQEGEAAGVGYRLEDYGDSSALTGAAALDKQP